MLDKGEHVVISNPVDGIYKIYKAHSNKKFSALTGDPITNGWCSYYAMDSRGRGLSKEFYTYVPQRNDPNQKFIVFAYQDKTTVTIENFNTFVLQKGGHYEDANIADEFIHVTADKPISALTCFSGGYYVPSANGMWSGTEFYTYLEKLQNFDEEVTVIAFDNNTFASIRDSDTNELIWGGTLNSGQAHEVNYPHGADKYFSITSSKTVTVCAQPWLYRNHDMDYMDFIPDKNGIGIGTDLIGATLEVESYTYLAILAHTDDTNVSIYNSRSGEGPYSYTLSEGESVQTNPGNDLWRIIADKDVTAYSVGDYEYAAEFTPLSFNKKFEFFNLTKVNTDLNNSCVKPWDPNKQNYLTFDINWSACGYSDSNVVIVDHFPLELDFDWSSQEWDCNTVHRTITWNLGNVDANASGHIVLRTKVNNHAAPCGQIYNRIEIEGNAFWSEADCTVDVCPWGSQIIYVDRDANAGFKNGTRWDNAYLELQDALTQARNCPVDVTSIWVAGGTYQPVNDVNVTNYQNISFELPQNVALIGHFGGVGTWETSPEQRNLVDTNNETLLDGQVRYYGESVRNVIKVQDATEILIDGFTVKGAYEGAGIYLNNAANVSIVNCKIIDNGSNVIQAENFTYPYIYNCTFSGNENVGLSTNSNCDTEISSCIFDVYGLWTTLNGIVATNISDVTIENCVLQNHHMSAIVAMQASVAINGCDISHSEGSGIELLNQNLTTTITNNWIHNNGDAGISETNQAFIPMIRNNTLYGNSTYGIWSSQQGADPNIINCIISGNEINDIYRQNGTFNKVNYCLLQHPHSGNGNITENPCFWNVENDDLHIKDISPCKNAGSPNVDYGEEKDIDGEPRIANGRVDIGGDEYYWSQADFDHNGIVNFLDYARFAPCWLKYADQNDYEPNCDFNANNYVDIDDLAFFCQDWLWVPAWGDSQWMAMSGGDMSESAGLLETDGYQVQEGLGLMLPDMKMSMDLMPVRLRATIQKFYDITPETTTAGLKIAKVSSYQPIVNETCSVENIESGFNAEQIQELIDWTEQIWQTNPELWEMAGQAGYDLIMESLKEQLGE